MASSSRSRRAGNSAIDVQPRSLDDLPPPETKRWVIRRKALVVAGVRNGIISLDDACKRYKLSLEEFLSWQRLIEAHGIRGLRTTRLQKYRQNGHAQDSPS